MTKAKIEVRHIERIEGHGNVHVEIADGRVEAVEMNIVEPARLFESMVRGHRFEEAPFISSRICGICSASHAVTDLKAIEKVFGIEVSERTKALRELLIYGSFLQNHATHLYVFAAPDFVGEASIFPLAQSEPELFAQALALKALGNELCTVVGGRSVHPVTAVVGGFTQECSAGDYLVLAEKMEAAIAFALRTVDLFHDFMIPDIQTSGEFLACVQDEHYPVESSDSLRFVRADTDFDAVCYEDYIEEFRVPHSSALFSREKAGKQPYMTGALARINASWQHLGKEAKLAAAKVGLRPPAYNPFLNNVAQAVELVDALDRCAGICRKLAADEIPGSSRPVDYRVRAGRGVGLTEAPRGVLIHDIELDAEGTVARASILTPTAQNLTNLEADLRLLAEHLLAEGRGEDEIRQEVEKLIRAYDPCLSCSVH